MNTSAIHLWTSSPELEGIVGAALKRSFSDAQICSSAPMPSVPNRLVVATEDTSNSLFSQALKETGAPRKLLLFGPLDDAAAKMIGVVPDSVWPFERCDADAVVDQLSPEAPATTPADESPLAIRYHRAHPLGSASPYAQRHFCRYDFYNEWNNLGYGRIGLTGGTWDLACPARANEATLLAEVTLRGEATGIAYATLLDSPNLSILWFNRATGPVDGLDWAIVESFFSDWRSEELPCNPYLLDIPYGYSGAVTMRLDCDQDLSSAWPLLELYQEREVPFSLAITTSLPFKGRDHRMVDQVLASMGAIVSHSHTHPKNWGGSGPSAQKEYRDAARWLTNSIPLARPDLAVSPFHENSRDILNAISGAGCRAFVAGAIGNGPEYLLARAGRVPFVDSPIVSLSQQCMLHGDCYHRRQDHGLKIFKEGFDQHQSAKGFFGYLDHPLSAEYQYGWSDEVERRNVHEEFLDYMQAHEGLWWANLAEALDFVRRKAATRITLGCDEAVQSESPKVNEVPCPAISYKGRLSQAGRAGKP